MYIHGGRDLKEGAISSMWRVNLSAIQQLQHNPSTKAGWEQVTTTGRDIGKISHHTCSMVSAKEIVFFGGLKGENSSQNVHMLNLVSNNWTNLALKSKIGDLGRDDHACADFRNGSFLTFGGYVNGSRVDEVVRFKLEGSSLSAERLQGGTEATSSGPAPRAGCSIGVSTDNMVYLFGGQEDDNRKLDDIWCYDQATNEWT